MRLTDFPRPSMKQQGKDGVVKKSEKSKDDRFSPFVLDYFPMNRSPIGSCGCHEEFQSHWLDTAKTGSVGYMEKGGFL